MSGFGVLRFLPFCLSRIFWVPVLVVGAGVAVVAYFASKDKEAAKAKEGEEKN